MRVVLTGGFGYVGNAFINRFNKEFDLIVISTKTNEFRSNVKVENISITNKKIVNVIEKLKADVIIHLAAMTGLKKCEMNKDKAFETNVTGTENIVKGCMKTNSKLIFISSREVYGQTINKKSNENDLLNPINIYGKTKMEAEKVIQKAAEKSEFNYIILRLTNVYGPGSNSGVNNIIKESISKEKIFVNGGEQILNFIFIEDVIELIHLVLLNDKLFRQIFNIGSRDTISLRKFVEILTEVLDKKLDIEIKKKPSFESSFFQPDLKKQQEVLGFNTKVDVKEGIKKTLQYMRTNV